MLFPAYYDKFYVHHSQIENKIKRVIQFQHLLQELVEYDSRDNVLLYPLHNHWLITLHFDTFTYSFDEYTKNIHNSKSFIITLNQNRQ